MLGVYTVTTKHINSISSSKFNYLADSIEDAKLKHLKYMYSNQQFIDDSSTFNEFVIEYDNTEKIILVELVLDNVLLIK